MHPLAACGRRKDIFPRFRSHSISSLLNLQSHTNTHTYSFFRIGEFHPTTRQEGAQECSYLSTLSLISTLEGGGWFTSHPGRLTPGNDPVSYLYRIATPAYHALVLRIYVKSFGFSQSQCPRVRRLRSAAARLLRLWARIPPGAWIFYLL